MNTTATITADDHTSDTTDSNTTGNTSSSTSTLPSTSAPYVLGEGEGEHRHFLNHLATTKVDPGADGIMTVVEFSAPRGFGPPLHVHDDEDEVMVILDGEIAFRSGDDEHIGTAGSTVYLPHSVPHTFQILSESARFSTVTARTSGAPRFAAFVSELGVDLNEPILPAPIEIDPGAVAEAGARYGITILGPPPAPLD